MPALPSAWVRAALPRMAAVALGLTLGVYLGNDRVGNQASLATAWHKRGALESAHFKPDGTLHRPSLAPHRRLLRWLRYHVYTAEVLARVWTRRGHAGRLEAGPRPGETPKVEPAARWVPLGLYLVPGRPRIASGLAQRGAVP